MKKNMYFKHLFINKFIFLIKKIIVFISKIIYFYNLYYNIEISFIELFQI